MNRLVDQRADLYSLGAVFYEMLTGRPPFVSADPVQLVHAHLARAPVPPIQGNPSVPGVLSDIVLKLLAKMPEGRYQSAGALLADLREAQERLEQTGLHRALRAGPGGCGRGAAAARTAVPARGAAAALLAAWERAAAGASRLVVLTGPGRQRQVGAGGGSCVTPIARRNGRLLTAKFDEQRGRAPYAPFAEAFRELVAELLSGPPAETAAWRQRIGQALGDNARVITELSPELERLHRYPAARCRRWGRSRPRTGFICVFQAFMRALATPEHPLVLFLDDLQWADTGVLAAAGGAGHRAGFVVVAHRRGAAARGG